METSPEGLHHTFPLPALILPSRGTKMRRAAKLELKLPVPWQSVAVRCVRTKFVICPLQKSLTWTVKHFRGACLVEVQAFQAFQTFHRSRIHSSRRRCLLAPRFLDASVLSTH